MGNLSKGTPMYPHLFVTLSTFFRVFAPRCPMYGMASMSIGTPCKEKRISLKILGCFLLKTLSEQAIA